MDIAIACKGLVKTFGSLRALDGVDLEIRRGGVTALLGPNGAGKSTTISLILGLLRPTSGEIRVLGRKPGSIELRRKLGAMVQEAKAPDGLTVRELLQLFRSYYPRPLPLDRLLDLSGLRGEAGRRATALSGGQRRRLQFALCMAGDPELILLDEPTTGMDVEARLRFWEEIRALASGGRTVLLTTHSMEEADALAENIHVIADGRIVAAGTPQQLKAIASMPAVSFTADRLPDEAELLRATGAARIERDGSRVRLFASDTDALLPVLFASGWGVRDIRVEAARLEDAYRQLTRAADSGAAMPGPHLPSQGGGIPR